MSVLTIRTIWDLFISKGSLVPGQGRGKAGARPGQGRGKAGARPGQGRGKAGARPGQGRGKAGARPGQGRGKAGARPVQGRGQGRGKAGARPGQGRGKAGARGQGRARPGQGRGKAWAWLYHDFGPPPWHWLRYQSFWNIILPEVLSFQTKKYRQIKLQTTTFCSKCRYLHVHVAVSWMEFLGPGISTGWCTTVGARYNSIGQG